MTYPYVQSQEKFADFLEKIGSVGVPESASVKWLNSIGFTSSNDERFLGALKFINMVENKRGGAPTEYWRKYRANSAETMAALLPGAYSDLYQTFPTAHDLDNEALASFFTANTDLGADAVSRIVATFKTMSSLADFSASSQTLAKEANSQKTTKDTGEKKDRVIEIASKNRPTVNINIQLQLPPDATGEVYEKFFEAMKNSLYPDE